SYTVFGNAGGGYLMIMAAGPVTVGATGSITAAGVPASLDPNGMRGAGAGGIIVLASRSTVTHSGSVIASGAAGVDGSSTRVAGGGGGGGIVYLLAPSISSTGVADVTGGR